MANILNPDKRAQIVTALCEGLSGRAVAHAASCSYDTVLKLGSELGYWCALRLREKCSGYNVWGRHSTEVRLFASPQHRLRAWRLSISRDPATGLVGSMLVGIVCPEGTPMRNENFPDFLLADQRLLLENIKRRVAALSLHAFWHNFCSLDKQGVTPCMAAELETRPWTARDVVALLPDTVTGKKRGPYKPRTNRNAAWGRPPGGQARS